ncbi:WAT1-related protein [Panicum miliaceum]|uniref:WAT1-related protein n=1 Tax=Panicum miliaceum TaxID=4540 RepID=A0A3L6SVU4_PANMI|nr:WAT1-related protein [Panicum miliaceum]
MDTGKKAYVVAIMIQLIYTGMYVVSKAAFNHGMSTFVFIFYRQAAATVLLLPLAIVLERRNAPPMSFWLFLKLFFYALLGNTLSMNLYNISLKYTSATVASATSNSVPVVTFFLAVLLRLEVVRLRSPSGMAKAAGVALCLAGVLTIALYTGPSMSPVNHHRAFAGAAEHHEASGGGGSKGTWIKGTFLMLLSNTTWSLWIVLQASLLKEYPNKLLSTLLQCLLSTAQSFLLAVAVERDPAAWKLRLDVGLLAVGYSGFVVTGVSFYLQAWCIEKRGPVFLAMSNPLGLLLTIFCSSFFLGEIVRLGSLLGSALLVGGLYSVLWGKSRDHLHHQHQPPPLPNQEAPKHRSTGSICSNGDDEEKQEVKVEQRKGEEETQLKDLFAMEASPLRHQVG